MRRGLLWTLFGSMLLSIAAVEFGQRPGVVAAVEPHSADRQLAEVAATATDGGRGLLPSQLPGILPRLELAYAKRDIFSQSLPTVPHSPEPIGVPVAVRQPTADPQAPAFTARFLGRMTTPEGKPMVFAMRGEAPIVLEKGQVLDDGYVVESIEPEAITFLYPSLDVRVVLPIPVPALTE